MIGAHIIFFFSIGCTKMKTGSWLGLNSVSFRIAFIRYVMEEVFTKNPTMPTKEMDVE